LQAVTEDVMVAMARSCCRDGVSNLCLAGGVAYNCVANSKIVERSGFEHTFIQPAAGDNGGSIGAALWASHEVLNEPRRPAAHNTLLGPAFGESEILERLKAFDVHFVRLDEDALCRRVAGLIHKNMIVGWFQGRMEFGPRALGARSILANPCSPDMKDILNHKIKRRESFRPFAPSILREHVAEWFEDDDDVPFMMQVYQIRRDRRAKIPAVTHVDGSGRLQTVDRHTNRRYWQLIDTFRDLTGVPMVLNTSFNENEPVVCRPQEALDCFLRTKMDVLVLGDWIVRRAA